MGIESLIVFLIVVEVEPDRPQDFVTRLIVIWPAAGFYAADLLRHLEDKVV